MKKCSATVIICFLLLSLFNINVFAAKTNISIGTISCEIGEMVSVPVEISGNTGFSNLGIEIGYDSSSLILKSVTPGNVGATYTAAQSMSENPYNMIWDSATSNITFNGTLATLTFEVFQDAAPGNYPITVSFYKGRDGDYIDGTDVNYDGNYEPLSIAYNNGLLKVKDSENKNSITVSKVQTGSTLNVKANLESDESVNGMVIAALFDLNGRLIKVKSCEAESEVDFSFSNTKDAAFVRVFWWDSVEGLKPKSSKVIENLK
ncbi:MAG: hypothetical protein J5590_02440 [Clostridia bacterium]|nr:hypothetical protein [Clostridia bacterium]